MTAAPLSPQLVRELAHIGARLPGAEVTAVREPSPAEAAPAAPAPPPRSFSLFTLAQLARDHATSLRDHQTRLVEAGLRPAPYGEALEHADMFDAIARLLERARTDEVILDRLRSGHRGGAVKHERR